MDTNKVDSIITTDLIVPTYVAKCVERELKSSVLDHVARIDVYQTANSHSGSKGIVNNTAHAQKCDVCETTVLLYR